MLRQSLVVILVLSFFTLTACGRAKGVLKVLERVSKASSAAKRLPPTARAISKIARTTSARTGGRLAGEGGTGTAAESKLIAGRGNWLENADPQFTRVFNERLIRISKGERVKPTRLQDTLDLSPESVRLYDARGNLVSDVLVTKSPDQAMVLEFNELLIRECLQDASVSLPPKASARDLHDAIVRGILAKAKPASSTKSWLHYDLQSFDLSIRLPGVGKKLTFNDAKINLKKPLRRLIYAIFGAAAIGKGDKLIEIRDKISHFLNRDSEIKIDFLSPPSGQKIDANANIKTTPENKADVNR